jgi:phosphatidylethanolamine/phosphatidyl-N-methylethanolamine N-methyltransferase
MQRRPQFLAAWIRSPFKIGSLTPSSRALARAMAEQVEQDVDGAIVELGGGTGSVTYALLEAGIDPKRIIVVERDPRLYSILHQHFPHIAVIRADACDLNKVLEERGIKKVAAVVSSLPLLSMPKGIRYQVEARMSEVLKAGGVLIQFTYGTHSPINHDRWRGYRIWGRRTRFVVANVPPAHVWVYHRERRIKPR